MFGSVNEQLSNITIQSAVSNSAYTNWLHIPRALSQITIESGTKNTFSIPQTWQLHFFCCLVTTAIHKIILYNVRMPAAAEHCPENPINSRRRHHHRSVPFPHQQLCIDFKIGFCMGEKSPIHLNEVLNGRFSWICVIHQFGDIHCYLRLYVPRWQCIVDRMQFSLHRYLIW